MKILAQFILFQIGYFLALFSAVYNWSFWTLGYAFMFLVLHLIIESTQRKQELLFLLGVFPIGVLCDLSFGAFGIYKFLTPKIVFGLAPEWLVSLWIIFPLLFGRSLKWMRNRLGVAFLFGLIFSPLSYRFGASIKVIEFQSITGYLIVGLVWGFLIAAFVYLRNWLDRNIR